MSKRKIFILSVAALLMIAGFFGLRYLRAVNDYKEKVSNIQVEKLDLNNIKDGEYEGSCDVDFIMVDLKVKVENHKIVKIDIIKHKNGRGKPAEAITGEVIKNQSVQVDAVSGATNSSKVILKAIEDALNKGRQS